MPTTWRRGKHVDMAFFAYDGSWRFPFYTLYEFHEIILNVMKYALNSLKNIFHSVSSPIKV